MKIALNYVGPLNFTLQRFVLSTLALSPLLIYVRRKIPMDNRAALKFLFLGAVNTSAIIRYIGD